MGRWRASDVAVSLGIPGVSLSGSWQPDGAERAAAWELLVELSTRTAAVDLADDEGLCRDALTSLHGLFETTRHILRDHGPGVARSSGTGNLSFGVIAVRVLNDVLRPLLNEWYPRLEAYEDQRPADVSPVDWERRWEHNQECRDALREVRPVVRQYLLVLAEAAEVHELAMAVLVPNGGQAAGGGGPGWEGASRGRRKAIARALGFTPRREMVRWFEPGVLVRTGWRIFRLRGRTDPREEMAPAPVPSVDLAGEGGDLWFDYVADLGDAFDPTMAVAWHLSRDAVRATQLGIGERIDTVPPGGLPRGRLLVMGGDEVYPYPTTTGYRDQTTGPYALACPHGDTPVVAIPGNHDWYDGLEAFTETFVSRTPFGGWVPSQDASWFSVRLPRGWWIWGIDTGLDGDVNARQRAYFAAMAAQLAPGDRVIVVHAVPAWHLREKRAGGSTDDELGRLEALLHELLPPEVTAPLFLAGDSHVYAHYTQTPAGGQGRVVHHVTSGGGGAFLHPTHNLAPKVPQSTSERDPFTLQSHWPPRTMSRHLLAASTTRVVLDRQNAPLALLLALVHLAFAGLAGVAARDRLDDQPGEPLLRTARHAATELLGAPVTWLLVALVVAVCALVVPHPNVGDRFVQRAARWWGAVHGVAQAVVFLAAATFGVTVTRALAAGDAPTGGQEVLGAGAGALVGGVLSVVVFAHYLRAVNQRYRIHDNEAFSGRHLRGYKHFVRGRIDERGDLRLYVVGLETVQPGWAPALADDREPPATALTLVDVVDIPSGPR